MPISTASAPASTTARTTSHHSRPSPPVTYGHEQLARRRRAARAGAPRGVTVECISPSISATCAASLSPRPDSVTSTVEPFGTALPASRASQPIACAGSSAGTMPSVADSSWKPASASSSVAAWYSARPVAASIACSGPTPGIVEAGADRRRLEHLAVLVLQEQRAHAVHDAGHAAADRRAVMTRSRDPSPPASTPTSRASVLDEAGERADRVRTAADARDDDVGIGAVEQLAALAARLVADDALELAHHPRERVRTHRRTEAVVRALDARDPVAHRFVHRVLQRRAPRLDRDDLGAEQLHAPHVERLALDVDRAHVDGAAEPEQRGRGRGRRRRAGPRRSPRSRCFLPMRRVSSACPSTLLILCEPVCVRSSRFSSTRTPRRSERRWHSVTGVGRPA